MSQIPITKVLYHAECPVGYAAYLAFHMHYTLGKIVGIPVKNGEPSPISKLDEGDTVFILDYSLSPDDLIEIVEKTNKPLTVLDHHISRFDTFIAQGGKWEISQPSELSVCASYNHNQNLISVIIDMEESGASLAWQYFFGPKIPEFISYIKDRDTGKCVLPDTEIYAAYSISLPHVPSVWEKPINSPIKDLYDEAKIAYNERQKILDEILENAFMANVHGARVPIVECNQKYGSDAAQRLIETHGTKFAGYFYYVGEEIQYNFSRKIKDKETDVRKFVEFLGGGGNIHAAGVRTNNTIHRAASF